MILGVITFLFKQFSSQLPVVSNTRRIGLSLLLLISHLYTWVDRSSSIPPPTPALLPLLPTFSRVLRARQLWKQCGICATVRGTGSLLYLPILTRFSRDIRGNKRCDIPALRRSKPPLGNFDARFTVNKGKRGTFWMASSHLKWGDTELVHKFAFDIDVFSIHNKNPPLRWGGLEKIRDFSPGSDGKKTFFFNFPFYLYHKKVTFLPARIWANKCKAFVMVTHW